MDRFLRLRIWGSDGQSIEFDNTVDDFWGINAGTADLQKIMMMNELSYGEFNASIFQVQVYGLGTDVKLNGRRILVSLEYQYTTEPVLLADENDNFITTETSDYIATQLSEEQSTVKNIFVGIINSSESDIIKTDRNIIAYDRAYTERDIDISSWWNSYWKSKIGTSVTLATFRTDLVNSRYITPESVTLVNDSVVIPNPFSSVSDEGIAYTLTFGDVLKMVCRLQNCTPMFTGSDSLEFITLGRNTYDIKQDTEGLNSTWKDFETEKVTGVAFYGESVDPIRVVGTTDNVYNIAGNLLTLNMTTATLDTIGNNILNDIKDIQYIPASVKMKVSRPEFEMGDELSTDGGTVYIMQQTLSGSLLVNQTLDAPAINATLDTEVTDYNDTIMQANKSASIEKEITDTNANIVLKADANGRIVQVALGANASTGSSFSVKADDIEFIANGKIQLQANNLSISAGLESMSDIAHNGVFLSPDGLYVKGSSGDYFKADKNGNINASNIDLDSLSFNDPSPAALIQLSMTGSTAYAKLSNVEITNSLTINSGKSLKYRGTELQTLLNAKKNANQIHTGTLVCSFNNGECIKSYADFGVSSRPNGLVLCPASDGKVFVTYIWDNSTSNIDIYARTEDSSGYATWFSGNLRITFICIT